MTEKQRRMLYLQEMEGMAQIAKSMMEDISHVQTSFIQATHIQHAKPMFKVRWKTLNDLNETKERVIEFYIIIDSQQENKNHLR